MMVLSDGLRFVVLLALGWLTLGRHLSMGRLDVAVLIFGMVSVIFRPAYMSLRRQIFTPEIRTAAISLTQMGAQMASLVGPALGGVLMSLGSAVAGFWFDAVTFLGSIGSLLVIRGTQPQLKAPLPRSAPKSFIQDILGGWKETARHPWIWIGNVAWTFIIIAYAGFIPILLPWLLTLHDHFPAYTYGLAMAMAGVGSLSVGAVVGSMRTARHGVWRNCPAGGGTGMYSAGALGACRHGGHVGQWRRQHAFWHPARGNTAGIGSR
jgi:MFS family permease